jgi:acetylornithine/succinyldiaminopimelate/putrescine aminotransferase
VLRREVEAVAKRVPGARPLVRGLGLLVALELEAPLERWKTLGAELSARRLSLHVDGKRGTAIFAPPLCIGEAELVSGVRAFGDAAALAFGDLAS